MVTTDKRRWFPLLNWGRRSPEGTEPGRASPAGTRSDDGDSEFGPVTRLTKNRRELRRATPEGGEELVFCAEGQIHRWLEVNDTLIVVSDRLEKSTVNSFFDRRGYIELANPSMERTHSFGFAEPVSDIELVSGNRLFVLHDYKTEVTLLDLNDFSAIVHQSLNGAVTAVLYDNDHIFIGSDQGEVLIIETESGHSSFMPPPVRTNGSAVSLSKISEFVRNDNGLLYVSDVVGTTKAIDMNDAPPRWSASHP